MNVYLAFSRLEADEFALSATKYDCIVTPAKLDHSLAQVICYNNSFNDDCLQSSSVCSLIRQEEEGISTYLGCAFKPFANNFYECSILPVMFIFSALDRALNISPRQKVEVIFKRKIRNESGSLKYFLAEHESQGVALYDRAYSLQPVIQSWLKHRGISWTFHSGGRLSAGGFKSLIRIAGVWGLRFLSDLRRVNIHSDVKPCEVDFVINVRSLSQLEFILPSLLKSDRRVALICGRSFSGESLLLRASVALRNTHHCIIEYAPKSYREIFLSYMNALPVLFSSKKYVLNLDGIKLDVSIALKEVRVMACELQLYEQSLDSILKDVFLQSDCFMSTEQKSPHANIDAKISRARKLKCAHLMQCDQLPNDIPFPVFGDAYFVDTKVRYEQFSAGWSTATERLFYVGAIKNEACRVAGNNITNDIIPIVCYFSDSDDTEVNRAIVERLCMLLRQQKLKQVVVKLHPRDGGLWLKSTGCLSSIRVVPHGELLFDELIDGIDIAISNPSGVVMDLLCREVPLMLSCLSERYSYENLPYSDNEFKSAISFVDQIDGLLNDPTALKNDVAQLKRRIISQSTGGSIFSTILNEMLGDN